MKVIGKNLKLSPKVLVWARERAQLDVDHLAKQMGVKPKRIQEWEKTGIISVKQSDELADKTHTPFGYLYLSKPQDDQLTIPDFRASQDVQKPSTELIDTINTMSRRQSWFREHLIELGQEKLPYADAMKDITNPVTIANDIREKLGMEDQWAAKTDSWEKATLKLRDCITEAGILVFVNGVVGKNTHRPLKADEFSGFALVDAYAPLIFINSTDCKAAQIFTMAHELAHIWRGKPGLSSSIDYSKSAQKEERLCSRIAAEFLISKRDMQASWDKNKKLTVNLSQLSTRYQISKYAVASCALTLDLITHEAFRKWKDGEERKQSSSCKKTSGGGFWKTQNTHLDAKFSLAVLRSAKEGTLLYREAYTLLGLIANCYEALEEQRANEL